MRLLAKTIVGSDIWKMNTKDSDKDYFEIYLDSTRNIFRGTPEKLKKFSNTPEADTHRHELQKVIEQLLNGNINFLIAVTSPIVIESTKVFEELREITFRNISKNSFDSIRGMAKHNYIRYILNNDDTSEKRCNKILRQLQFGITLLKYRKLEYKPFTDGTPDLIKKKFIELQWEYTQSTIPEKPDEEEFRAFLCRVRRSDWWNQVW